MAFMFASANLVIELGAVIWILMGWRFVLAEFGGAFLLIGLVWGMVRWVMPQSVKDEARKNAQKIGSLSERDQLRRCDFLHLRGSARRAVDHHLRQILRGAARVAVWITGILFDAMVVAGIVINLVFGVFGLIPTGERPPSAVEHAQLAWTRTRWLDCVAVVVFAVMLFFYFRKSKAGERPAAHAGR